MIGARRDEFHVGHVDETPPDVARFARRIAIGFLLLAAVLGAVAALLLERFDEGVFEYGVVGDHAGELLLDPHPRLIAADGPAAGYLLVGTGKHGLDVSGESSPPWTPSSSRKAEISATLIRNPEAAMLEVHSLEFPEGPEGKADAEPAAEPGVPADRGQTLLGEIVDTKCYLSAMKPGRGKPHRDCASLCIRGGVPAALLVRTENGERRLVHLLDPRGQALGHEVLDWVGEPVEARGTLRRRDGRFFLRTFGIRPTRAPAAAPFVLPSSRTHPSPTASSR